MTVMRTRLHGLSAPACCVAAACILLASPLDAQRATIQSHIRGRVIDEKTGEGIPNAFVEFMDGRTRIRSSATTAADGSFVLTAVPPGDFRIRAARMGYVRTLTPYWRVASGETLTITVRLDPDVVLLAPLEINARARSQSPVLADFYRRAERRIAGVFITRAEIESRNALYISDLLLTVPGIELHSDGVGSGQMRIVRFSRSTIGRGGGTCPVQIFVDGTLASRRGEVAVDELASPAVLEGIEVHRGLSSVPPEFVTADARCGVIALWTRRGG